MATGGPKHLRSVKQQDRATYKRSSDEGQTADATCRCRESKKTLCQYCKKSPKMLKLIKGKTTSDLTDDPKAVTVPAVVTETGAHRLGSRYWDVNFTEYFSKDFKKVLEIKPGNWCYKIKHVKEKIWVPISNGHIVNVYNNIGNIQKSIHIKYPRVVELVYNGDICIVCVSGLYIMDHNESPQKICKGSFADVYGHRDKMYALEYNKKMIMEFVCRPDVDDVQKRWRREKECRVDDTGEFDNLIVTGDGDLKFFVSHYDHNKIGEYNKQGHCIRQFGSRQETGDGNIYHPWLCGVDRQSHLLVADMQNNVYKILDPGTGQWRSTGVRGENYVFYATLDDDGNLWLIHHNGKEFIITKHEPQLLATYY